MEKKDELREAKAKITLVDRPARVGDLLLIDLTKKGTRLENQLVQLGDRSLPDEMNKAMVGMTKGGHKDFEVEVKEGESEVWHIRVKEVKEKIVLTDEELARTLGFASVEEMEEELSEEVEQDLKKLRDTEIKEKISRYLIERHNFPLPAGFVEEEYQSILKRRNETDNPSNRERFQKLAEDRVRLMLVLVRIAEKEGIEVSDEEIDKRIQDFRVEKNEDVATQVEIILLREKVLDFLMNQAQITKKERIISPWSKDDNRSIRNRTDW
ncbi:MAG TPA: hypothetical protein EYP24_04350 [bacterium (Candidatus Stahlbacteria)]|nr:hypothetical protein [Candidatus Stahlbacteria bacterium]